MDFRTLTIAAACLIASAWASGQVATSTPSRATAITASAPAAVAAGPAAWKLPPRVRLNPPRFRVCADGNVAIYAEYPSQQAAQAATASSPAVTYWLLPRGAAAPTSLADLLPESARKAGFTIRLVEPSPKCDWLLMLGKLADQSSAQYAVNLRDRQVQQIGHQPRTLAVWAGEQLVLAEEGEQPPPTVALVTPTEEKWQPLPIHGMVLAASQDASTLLVMRRGGALGSQEAGQSAGGELRVAAVGRDGKTMRELVRERALGQPPILSPGGKYVAYLQRPTAAGEKPVIHVLSTAGTEDRQIADFALVIGLTDAGDAITFGVGDTSDGTPVKFQAAGGASRVLVAAAQAAAVVDGKVFYVTPGEAAEIRSVGILIVRHD